MTFDMRYQITARYLTKPSKRRSGLNMSPSVRFIVAHDTGNPGSTAANNVAYYERTRNELSASAHLFVDDREILECVPALTATPEKAWHVRYGVETDDRLYGLDANDAAIGIEYCYGDNIDADAAYDRYVWVTAFALHTFELNPLTDIVGHYFLDPRRRTDPVTGLAYSRRTYEQFQRDVRTEYRASRHDVPDSPADQPQVTDSGTAEAVVRLNIRKDAPSTRAPVHQTVGAGTRLTYTGSVDDGEAVNGNPVWLIDEGGHFFWSGGVRPAGS